MTDLDRLEELAKAATPGPWTAGEPTDWDGTPQASVSSSGGALTWDDHGGDVFMPEDAKFISAANPAAVLALIADHRAVLARIAKVEALHQRVGAPWQHIGGVYVCLADNSVWPCPTMRALTEGENE